MSLVSSFLLAGSTFLFVRGYLYHQKEKLYTKLFQDVERCPEFDFDYIQNLSDLPVNKIISFCAQTDNDDESIKSARFKQNSVLFSSIVEDKDKAQDKIWKTKEGTLKFRVRNMLGHTIDITNKNNEVFLYNLKKIDTVDNTDLRSKIIQLSPLQNLQILRGKKIYFTEYGVLPESHNVFIGVVNKDLRGNFSFTPKVLSGESRGIFLKYLDEYIVDVNKKGKRTLYVFFALVLFETCRKTILRYNNYQRKNISSK